MTSQKSSSQKNRLLILGFDGASPDLLMRWVDEGKLPTIKELIAGGAYGPLRSVANMSSPPAWTSFSTGKNPGKHGIFCFTERDFSSYRYTYVNGGFRRAETFWEKLCPPDSDRTGCIINVPMTYPSKPLNGCMISGIDAPGVDSENVCYPADLVKDMIGRNGPYRITPDFATFLRRGGHWGDAAQRLLDNMDTRFRHMKYLMERYDWDLFTVVFGEPDLGHHFFWKFMDSRHADYNAEDAEKFGDTILRIYQRMDEITREMIERNPDATILIVSDHGGGLETRGVEVVTDWLESLGLLARETDGWRNPKKLLGNSVRALGGWGFGVANRYLPKDMKVRLAKMMPKMRETVEATVLLKGIDWPGTKAYCDGRQEDIWINLIGRDPLGIVPEHEYDALCDFICEELRGATDVVTGKPIVDEVFRRKDRYSGKYVDKAPDITFRWKDDGVINGIVTKHSGNGRQPKRWDWPPEQKSGGHSPNGILIAAGPRVAHGVSLEKARLMDISPTVLYFFDEKIPAEYDGKVIEEIFDPAHLKNHPPQYAEAAETAAEQGEDEYSEEDSAVIEQRLRDLGYL